MLQCNLGKLLLNYDNTITIWMTSEVLSVFMTRKPHTTSSQLPTLEIISVELGNRNIFVRSISKINNIPKISVMKTKLNHFEHDH